MPLLLIKGEYRILGNAPDGDTVRFYADDPGLWAQVPQGVRVGSQGSASLRLEGIDALETHYQVPGLGQLHQRLALSRGAAGELLSFLGFTEVRRDARETVTAAQPAATRGFVVTRFADKYGRCTAIAFRGEHPQPDGAQVYLDAAAFRESLNQHMVVTGLAYPTFYRLMYPDLRGQLTQVAQAARAAQAGVWKADVTTEGFTLSSLSQLTGRVVLLPKLFRRLAEFIGLSDGRTDLTGFLDFVKAKRDRLVLLPEGHTTGLDNLLDVRGQHLRLIRPVEDLIFDEHLSAPGVPG